MKRVPDQALLDRIVSKAVKRKNIFGAVFYVSDDDQHIDLISASGELKPDSRYYIASINKLFVSAIILRMYNQGRLKLEDAAAKYLPDGVMKGLHIYNGNDYSDKITLEHLLSLTSGLPCYLADKRADGRRIMTELESGIDQAWPPEKVMQEVGLMKPHFPPGAKGKAKYGDTNHQLLSMIIENIEGQPVDKVLEKLFNDLQLSGTYVCREIRDRSYAPIRYKSEVRDLPLFLTSTRNDIISTAKDQMTFIKAFFNGYFIPVEQMKELEKWNNIFFPFRYGIGLQKFHIPRFLSPFKPVPDMIGHSGSTGSVAYYVPERKIYITGTVNQQASPNVAFQTMIKIISQLG